MDTRNKIINVALKNFMSKGYDKTSLNEIVEECNVSKGAFYHYFKNKDELFMEILMDMMSAIEKWTIKNVASKSNFRDFIKAYFNFPEFFKEWGYELKSSINMYRMIFDAMRIFPELKKQFSESYKQHFQHISELMKDAQNKKEIRPDIDSDSFAVVFVVLVEGFVLFDAIFEDGNIVSSKIESIADEMWNLIKL